MVFAPGSIPHQGRNYYREPHDSNRANTEVASTKMESILPGNVVWQSGGRQGRGEYLRTRYHSY
ncbi:MAG: hypothetical protein ACLR0U_03740 [Enterocloster clostridioformis]